MSNSLLYFFRHCLCSRTRSAHIQFLRYLFVGGSSAVFDLTAYTVGIQYFQLHYLIANIFAFIFGLSWNYLFGLYWVFESRHHRTKEVLMVFTIASLGLLWTELLLLFFVEVLHLGIFVAKIIAIWMVLFWNFGMRKFYVFH